MKTAALLLLSTLSLCAGTVEYHAIFDSVNHGFFSGGALSTATSAAVAVEPRPFLTADFSLDKQLRFVYAAPAGKRFVIAPLPAGASGYQMSIDLTTHSVIAADDSTAGVSMFFHGLTGPAPTPFGFGGTFDSAGRFSAGSLFNISGPFSFESVEMLFDVPPAFNSTMDAQPYRLFLSVSAFFPRNYTAGDPGPVLSIADVAPVPEPSSLLLMCGAVLALAGVRQRLR